MEKLTISLLMVAVAIIIIGVLLSTLIFSRYTSALSRNREGLGEHFFWTQFVCAHLVELALLASPLAFFIPCLQLCEAQFGHESLNFFIPAPVVVALITTLVLRKRFRSRLGEITEEIDLYVGSLAR